MIINHNMPGVIVGRYANATDRRLKGSIEKLSSGLKINRAGDDSAGLAVSEKMRAQISGLMQASANSEDGIGMIDTFEGALTETHAILRRIKTLAVQSANGNYSNETDRAAIELEYEELLKELDDIAETDFNGVQVLNKRGVPETATGAYKQMISLPILTNSIVLEDDDFIEFTNLDSGPDSLKLHMEPGLDYPLKNVEYGYHVTDRKFYVDIYTDSVLKGSIEYPLEGSIGFGSVNNRGLIIDGEDYGIGYISYQLSTPLEFTKDVPYRKFPNVNKTLDATFLPSADGFGDPAKYEPTVITIYDPADEPMRFDASGNQYTKTGIGVRDYNTTTGAGQPNAILQGLTLTDDFAATLPGGKMYGKYEVNTWQPGDTDTPTGGPGINFYSDSAGNAVIASTGDIGGLSVGETVNIYTVPDGENTGNFTLGGILYINDTVEVDVNTTSVGVYSNSSMDPANLTEYGIADENGLAEIFDASMIAPGYDNILGSKTGFVVFQPTEEYLAELAAEETAEPEDSTRGESQSLSLQVGSRTKDLKNYNFEYGQVWTEERVQREAIGDLTADICATAEGLGLVVEKVNLSTQFNANAAIDAVDRSIAKVSLIRASFGSIHNRLGHKIENLNTTTLNIGSSESGLRDTNVADGVADMMKEQALMSTVNKMAVIAGNQLDGVLRFFE
jgi:flagellin-like hook-associated protein FlgL